MTNRYYPDSPTNITGPACGIFAVTPNNDNDLPAVTRGIYVGAGGDLVVVPAYGDGTAVKFVAVPTGAILPIMVTKVKATDTTAQNLVAMF